MNPSPLKVYSGLIKSKKMAAGTGGIEIDILVGLSGDY